MNERHASSTIAQRKSDVTQWMEAGPWTKAGAAPAKQRRAQPSADFANDELSRRYKKIKKKARKVKTPDPRRRHKLRIAVKNRPIRSVVVQVINPGALNPAPRSIAVDSISFVSYK